MYSACSCDEDLVEEKNTSFSSYKEFKRNNKEKKLKEIMDRINYK